LENPNGATIIKPPMLTIGDITETLGLSSTVIRVKYYVNDLEVIGSITQNLSFNLKQTLVEITPTLYNFNVNVNGFGNSVRVVKNGKVEFFPDNGSTPYSDLIGTTFNIESANPSLYRITQIQVNSSTPIVANANESLTYSVKLVANTNVSILSELVPSTKPALNPTITLLKNQTITYNINSKLGVPIGFTKNADVKAVTVIVGEDILEFDDLQEGDIAGITIPHSVFKNIGQYGAKIFPFSLNDYEKEVRPAETAIKITPKPLPGIDTPSKEILTEVVKPIKPKVIVNPYVGGGTPSIGNPKPKVTKRTIGGGSRNGGGGPSRNRNEQNYR